MLKKGSFYKMFPYAPGGKKKKRISDLVYSDQERASPSLKCLLLTKIIK